MIKVETILLNPLYNGNNKNEDKYINLETLKIDLKKESYYGFIQIREDNKIVFKTDIELIPEMWFISLQIIEECLDEGEGYWQYPELYKLKSIENNQIQIIYNNAEFITNKEELLNSLLDSLEYFINIIPTIVCNPDGISATEFKNGIDRYKSKVSMLRLKY